MLILNAQPAGGGMTQMLLMLGIMFVIIWFFMIQPQRKQQKEIEKFRNNLNVGDKIVTAGGIYGTVKDLNLGENYISIEISKGVVIKINRNQIYADSAQANNSQKA